MNNWLIKFAEARPTEEEKLAEAIESLSAEDLHQLAFEEGLVEPTEHIDSFEERFSQADQMGRELAHVHGDELEKSAFAITERGHKFDAERYRLLARQAAERAAHQQEYGALAAVGAPANPLSALRFHHGADIGRPDAAARHYEYAAKKHEQGRNAWNPFGGSFTPSSHEQGGTTGLMSLFGKSVPNKRPKKTPKKEKVAIVGAVAGLAARALPAIGRLASSKAAKGVAKDVAGDMVTSAISNKAQQGFQKAQQGFQSSGGFKYANSRLYLEAQAEFELEKQAGPAAGLVKSIGTGTKGNNFLRGAASTMMRNPSRALGIAGAGAGAAQGLLRDPGYDEMGNKKSRVGAAVRGAVGGGALGYGAGKLVPGAGKAVQGMGKSLSGELRGHSWRNQAHPSLNKATQPKISATPAASAAAATPGPAKAAPVAKQTPVTPKYAPHHQAAVDASSSLRVPASSMPPDYMVNKGGMRVPASQLGDAYVMGGRVKQASYPRVRRVR